MSIIRQSTARTVLVGPVLDSSGAAKTDEVVGSIKVTKNGTVGAANGSATLTHDHAGKYKLALTTSDTDTVGVLEISLNSGTNDMPVARLNVVEEAVFDAYFAASATMAVTLAPDAIKDSSFDESTAFPVKSADTGVTALARNRDAKQIQDQIEFQRGHHTVTGSTFYVDGIGGNDTTGDGSRALPYKTISKALTAVTSNAHDQIILLPNASGGPTTITESAAISVTKNYVQIRGPGRDMVVTRSNNGDIFDIQANGVGLSGFRIATFGGATSNAIVVSGGHDFVSMSRLWIESAHQDAIYLNVASRCEVVNCVIVGAVRDAVRVASGAGSGTYNLILDNVIRDSGGSAVNLQGSDASDCRIQRNVLRDNAVGVTVASGVTDTVITDNRFVNNTTSISDSGTNTLNEWNMFASEARSAVGLSSANLDTQLGDLPTNAELSAALAAADDAVLAAIAALNNLSSAGAQAAAAAALTAYDAATGSDVPSAATNAAAVRTELATELARVDVATSTRLAASGYTAPANSDIAAIKAKTDNLPADPADASDVAAAISGLAATLATIQGYVDDLETRLTSARAGYLDKLNVAGTLAHSDAASLYKADVSLLALEATAQSLKVVTDKLATMVEQDGGVYRYTTNALEQAPTGEGGGGATAQDVWEYAGGRTITGGTVDTLTNAPDVPTPEEIADAVLDAALDGHADPGSVGEAIAAAGTAGDPWIGALPGDYDEGQAGHILSAIHERLRDQVAEGPVVVVPAPPLETQTTAWVLCLDEAGQPEEGAVIEVRMFRPATVAGWAYDDTLVSATSNEDGIAAAFIPRRTGVIFEARRGTSGRWVRFRGVNAETVLLPSVLGTP